jgi:DNA-binding ferritin-like protein (Dps family)
MMTKIMDTSFKNRFNNFNETKELINELERKLPHLKGDFDKLDVTTIYSFLLQYNQMSNNEMEIISEFITMYEKHQITGVDINQIKTLNEIESVINLINIKNIGKEFSKQTYTDLDTEKWLVIRPLTYESSLKYGAHTKWCTAAKHNPYQFFRYTEEGVLVYCINKDTGYKLAFHMFRNGNKFYDISFWNSVDERIDSLSAEIDFDVYQLIKNIYTSSETKTNKELGGEYWAQSHDLHMKEDELEPTPLVDGGPIRTVNRRVRNEVTVTIDEPINDQPD